MIIAILGRETRLSLAELEATVGANRLHPFGPNAAMIDSDIAPLLAGSPKVGTVIEEMAAAPWELQTQQLMMSILRYVDTLPVGKVTLGMSVYGTDLKPKQIQEFLLDVKKQLKSRDRSVRIVPNKDPILNAASITHNKLTNQRSADLLYVQFGNRALLGRTTRVQDIDAFTQRDRDKPARDSKVGMLPPKLAHLMLTLALKCESYQSGWILDPFCGSGTVLLEASVHGCQSYGTDIADDMVNASQKNAEWLAHMSLAHGEIVVEPGDATTHQWKLKEPITAVVSEGYLGPPLKTYPRAPQLTKIKSEVNSLMKKFLKNIHPQLKPGTPVVVALPAWHKKDSVTRLPLVDEIDKLGYTRRDFEHTRGPLIYHREKQVVGRDILVLVRK